MEAEKGKFSLGELLSRMIRTYDPARMQELQGRLESLQEEKVELGKILERKTLEVDELLRECEDLRKDLESSQQKTVEIELPEQPERELTVEERVKNWLKDHKKDYPPMGTRGMELRELMWLAQTIDKLEGLSAVLEMVGPKERQSTFFEHWEGQFFDIDDQGQRVPSELYPEGVQYEETKGKKFRISGLSEKPKKKKSTEPKKPRATEPKTQSQTIGDLLKKHRG